MIKKILLAAIIIGSALAVRAQDTPGYQLPPAEIVSIVDAPQTPGVLVSRDNNSILLLERPELPSIADLSRPELPAEAHGYDARKSLLHMHWEYVRWLDKYVKNKK